MIDTSFFNSSDYFDERRSFHERFLISIKNYDKKLIAMKFYGEIIRAYISCKDNFESLLSEITFICMTIDYKILMAVISYFRRMTKINPDDLKNWHDNDLKLYFFERKVIERLHIVEVFVFEKKQKELNSDISQQKQSLNNLEDELKTVTSLNRREKLLSAKQNLDYPQISVSDSFLINSAEIKIEPNKNVIKAIDPKLIAETKKFIQETIQQVDPNMGWRFVFKNEQDFNSFIDLITDYFVGNTYSLPKSSIKLKINCQTRFAKILRTIHGQCSEIKLIRDQKFYDIIRTLNFFESLTDHQIYKKLIS